MLGQNPLTNHNLVRQVSVETITRPNGFYATIFVDVLSVFLALLTSWTYRSALSGSISVNWVVAAAAAFTVLSVFGMLLGDRAPRRGIVILLQTAAFLVFFVDTPWQLLVVGGIATYLLLVFGHAMSYRDLSNSLEIRFLKIVRPQIKRITTAIVLLGVLLYLPQWRAEEAFMSFETFNTFFTGAANAAGRFYPEVRFNSTVGSFAESIAQNELQRDPRFSEMPEGLRTQVFTQAAVQVLVGIRKSLSVEARPEQGLSQFFYEFLKLSLERWQKKFGSQFLIVWAVAAFFLIRSLGAIFSFGVGVATALIYQLLIATNIIQIIPESQMREVVRYSR